MTGATTGNLNGSGTELALINNNNASASKISTFTIDANNNINNTCNYTFSGGNCNYLASGDIIPSITGDEIVTFDNYLNNLKVFNKTGSVINLVLDQFIPMATITGIGIGEFNSNHAGKEILLSHHSGNIYMFGFNLNTFTIDYLPLNNNILTYTLKYAGMTVGDFDGNGSDEIVVYSNAANDAPIQTLSIINGNQLQYLSHCSENNYGNSWNGITPGDFDGDGTDELMLHRSSDSKFLIYKQTQNGIVLKNSEIFPANQQNGIMCSAPIPNYPHSDALISCRNYDGQISVFNMEGLCPGLNINSPITGSTSIDNNYQNIYNNYTIDYHVNNTIVASNIISSPSIVEMSSGKEIVFKSGFAASEGADLYAYIEPALECNPATFRKSILKPKPNNAPEYSYYQKTGKPKTTNTIKITPNPNAGVFQITITKNDKPTGIKELKVIDMLGKIIWQTAGSANNVFEVDISNCSQGIYFIQSVNEQGEIEIRKLVKQ